jgi:multisubunit Na+/H+ antiporter MnhB subunit
VKSVLLRSTVKILWPVIVALAVYLLLRGHDAPGGGFIAGLAVAIGIALRTLVAERREYAFPIRSSWLIGAGLGLALITGFGSLVLGSPFLTSAHAAVHLPGGAELELHTTLVFDLGVFLVVVGTMTALLDSFTREPSS